MEAEQKLKEAEEINRRLKQKLLEETQKRKTGRHSVGTRLRLRRFQISVRFQNRKAARAICRASAHKCQRGSCILSVVMGTPRRKNPELFHDVLGTERHAV